MKNKISFVDMNIHKNICNKKVKKEINLIIHDMYRQNDKGML